MTRNNAREIAVQMIFELTFGNRSVEALLEEEFTKEHVAEIGEECALYAEFPKAGALHQGAGPGGVRPRAGAGYLH